MVSGITDWDQITVEGYHVFDDSVREVTDISKSFEESKKGRSCSVSKRPAKGHVGPYGRHARGWNKQILMTL